MSYFSSHYSKINYAIPTDELNGLRNAQLGAIFAIGSHFTLYKSEPALVVLPTGAGKTAVLNLSAYLLRANRVLVISSSVLVRGQIVDEFSNLITLKHSNVFGNDLPSPNVKEVKSPIKSSEEWESFRAFDVVIGIPNSINEGINNEFRPAEDLFDLILVDEAHHVPAFTWRNVIKAFPDAKKIFFTATPFRRDRREIEGRLAFNYPLTKAYDDKIFGDIGYYPVITTDINTDLAIAVETERVYNKDKEEGFIHFIMVRTETKDDAELLSILYAEKTSLKLKKVDSTLTYKTIKKTIEQLKAGELDGIICVDMLGEGFDFPNLKIAAIHSPKKSLANTLQFIGRFARTNADNIGEAKFLALPSDIEIGKKRLYQEGAIWNDIIKNLSEEVIEEEDEIKAVLDTFENEDGTPKGNLSFYNLHPFCHVKVYKANEVNLETRFETPGQEIIYHAVSTEHNSVVFITKEVERPKWLSTDDLINVSHYFFLIYFDETNNLLFIHSSIKTSQFYDSLVEAYVVGEYSRVSKFQINKVLLDVEDPEFFNIGMQNRSANSGETYRIIAGPNAETTIRNSHAKNYANGHVFMKGKSEGIGMTVGYSSGSKVWSNAYEKIPNFIKWCQKLAVKIVSDRTVKTNTGFDNLPIGKVVDNFQLAAHSASWHSDTYSEAPFLIVSNEDEILHNYQLLDFEIKLHRNQCSLHQLCIDLTNDEITIPLSYDFVNHFQYRIAQTLTFTIDINGQQSSLLEYLNEAPLIIFLDDFAAIINHEFYDPPQEGGYQYNIENLLIHDWNSLNTDITREFYIDAQEKTANNNKNSIHESLRSKLLVENYDLLIYDHGTGEVADFITFKELNDKIEIVLYHVKGSTGDSPGDRVGDVYEVCMQAVKSQSWTTNKNTFKNKIKRRTEHNSEKFLVGDLNAFLTLLGKVKPLEFFFAIVQPGISKETFSAKLSYILAAADDSLINSGYRPLIAIGS